LMDIAPLSPKPPQPRAAQGRQNLPRVWLMAG
jgi:hypothetical protein